MIRFHYYTWFNSHGEKPFCPIDHLERAFCNLICYIAFGKRYEHDDENLQKMLQLLHRNFEVANFAGLEAFLPFLRHVPFFGGLRDMEKIRDFSITFFGDLIKETSSNYVPGDPRNFIDICTSTTGNASSKGSRRIWPRCLRIPWTYSFLQ